MPPIMIMSVMNGDNIEEETKKLLFSCFSFFLYCKKANIAIITPIATIITPTIEEYPFVGKFFVSKRNASCFKNNENFTITKPKPIKAMLVRIHARKVLSFARCSLDLSIEFFSSTLVISFCNFEKQKSADYLFNK